MGQADVQVQVGRPEQQGRMYASTTEEAVQDASVIIGTLLIHSTPVVVLFDSCSTHTFIAKTFVDRIDLCVKDLGYDLVESTPT